MKRKVCDVLSEESRIGDFVSTTNIDSEQLDIDDSNVKVSNLTKKN